MAAFHRVWPTMMTPLFVHHDGLAEAELAEAGRHGLDRLVVDAGVVLVGPDVVDVPQLDVHVTFSRGSRRRAQRLSLLAICPYPCCACRRVRRRNKQKGCSRPFPPRSSASSARKEPFAPRSATLRPPVLVAGHGHRGRDVRTCANVARLGRSLWPDPHVLADLRTVVVRAVVPVPPAAGRIRACRSPRRPSCRRCTRSRGTHRRPSRSSGSRCSGSASGSPRVPKAAGYRLPLGYRVWAYERHGACARHARARHAHA